MSESKPVELDGYNGLRVRLVNDTPENREIFSRITTNIDALMEILDNDFNDIPEVRNLLTRFNADNIYENVPTVWSDDTSYTLDKSQLHVCTTCGKTRRKYHDFSLIFHVVLHELAHYGIDEHDHPPQFWKFFAFLQLLCEKYGIEPIYVPTEKITYCNNVDIE